MKTTSSRLWSMQFVFIILVTFLFFLALQMLTEAFPVHVTKTTHSPATGGLMTTAFMLAGIMTRPLIGIFMHKVNMKRILIAALVFVFVCIGFSYGQSAISFLIILRALEGICFGAATTLLATFATNLIPHERIGEGIGYFGVATSLGTTLGPMLALSFLNTFSFNTLLMITMGIIIVAFVFSLTIKNFQNLSELPARSGTVLSYAFDKGALLPSFLVMLFYFTFAGIVNFIGGWGDAVHLKGPVSFFFLINAIVMLLIRPISGKVYDKFGHKFLIYPGGIAGIIGLFLLAFSHSFSMFIAAAILYGLAYGVMQPSFQAWAVSRVSPEKKGTANAMVLSFMDLGMALGSVALGSLAGQISYSMMYGCSSILIIVLLSVYMIGHFKKRKADAAEQKAA